MNYAPLSASFMVSSIMGLLISLIWIWKFNKTWGLTLTLVFATMLIASLMSMTKAKPKAQLR